MTRYTVKLHKDGEILNYLDKSNNVEVFYDAITKNMLGYKERNKEYKENKNTDNYH